MKFLKVPHIEFLDTTPIIQTIEDQIEKNRSANKSEAGSMGNRAQAANRSLCQSRINKEIGKIREQ
jgi:hypothetical protein